VPVVSAPLGVALVPVTLTAVEGPWHPHAAELQGPAVVVVGATLLLVWMLSVRAWDRLRVAARTGRLPGGIGALPTETRPSHDRPRGYKVAKLVVDPASGQAGFLGLTVGGLYGGDTAASCEVLDGWLPPPRRWGRRRPPPVHDVPDLSCSCGFHAFTRRPEAVRLLAERPPVSRQFGAVLLEVDLAGTVIEFDRGFRASHQRVLGVQVPRWCVPCAARGQLRAARRVAGLPSPEFAAELRAELPRYPPAYRVALSVHHQAMLERLAGRVPLRGVCEEHTPRATSGTAGAVLPPVALDLADLASHLGTEVRWLAEEEAFDVAAFVEAMSWTPPGHRGVA
jgi:hypothetical protein